MRDMEPGQSRAAFMAYIRYMSMLIFPPGVGLASIATRIPLSWRPEFIRGRASTSRR